MLMLNSHLLPAVSTSWKTTVAEACCGGRAQDSREERTFRVWLLSLLRGDVTITSLAEGLRDGYVLLRVLDVIAPGCVRWPAVHVPPFRPLRQAPWSIENGNSASCFPWRPLAETV
jgi:hypothetical protein